MKISTQTCLTWALLATFYLAVAGAATFTITNQCNYTVWAAATPGGGRRLDKGQTWTLDVAAGTTTPGRIWGRTNCSFDANGQGQCQTGDCGRLECQEYGKAPNTLAEFALNEPTNVDYLDISLVDGFNIPMEFSSATAACRARISCSAPIVEECPAELRTPGGCNSPCNVFGTSEYCCTSGPESCAPTTFSRFFRDRCPQAYSYPPDGRNTAISCRGGTNYRVLFCP